MITTTGAPLLLPDWLIIIGAAAVAALNVLIAVRSEGAGRYDRVLVAVAYAQLAAFYLILHLDERSGALPIGLARSMSRFVWLWFICIGLLVGWRSLRRRDQL